MMGDPATYAWRHGSFRQKHDPQVIGEAIEALIPVVAEGEEAQPLETGVIVKAAESRTSPLHPLFEWDDSVAADAFRHQQARGIIQDLQVSYVTTEGAVLEDQRAFLNVVVSGKQGYMTVVQVVSDKNLLRQALRAALDELNRWRRRYADLQELAGVFAVIDQLPSFPDEGLDETGGDPGAPPN